MYWRCRRISGILFPLRGDCHFSRPAVTRRLKRPTLRRRTSSPFEAEASLSLYLDLQPIRFTPSECRHPMRELLPRVFTLACCRETFQETSLQQAVYLSVALSVALAGTFLLRSMVLCAVPTFLAPAFPTRDSLPESRCKDTAFLDMECFITSKVYTGRQKQPIIRGYKDVFLTNVTTRHSKILAFRQNQA